MTQRTATAKNTSYRGFSGRLNELLDAADYPPLDYGRAKALADEYGVSKSGARKWIREDSPPRPQQLQTIVKALYKKTGLIKLSNTNKAIAWLQYGDEVGEPASNPILLQANHILLSNVYLNVHRCARELGIDIEALPQPALDKIYDTVITQTIKQSTETPDPSLIKNLLEIINDK